MYFIIYKPLNRHDFVVCHTILLSYYALLTIILPFITTARNTNLPYLTIYYMWSHDLVKLQVERPAIYCMFIPIQGLLALL